MNTPRTWKRSNAPIFWALFGGGGTLSSLFGPVELAKDATGRG